ncbi:MAG TPA: hypothetical protein VGO08_12750 [Burkholderiales bacterium]|nr:hypothetical protein [Burkholderiales bacterium]
MNWLALVGGFAVLPLSFQLLIATRAARSAFGNDVLSEVFLVAFVIATAAIYEIQTSLVDVNGEKNLYLTLTMQAAVLSVGAYVVFKSYENIIDHSTYPLTLLFTILSALALSAVPIELVRRSKVM